MMDVRPIRTEADLQAALADIATLMNAEKGTPEGDRLDILATLVEAYEAAHVLIEAPDPISAILFMMEQKHLSRRDLEPAIGSRARVAEVLNRRRTLTLPMIRRLSGLLDIPADVLIQSYKMMRPVSPRQQKAKRAVPRRHRSAHAAQCSSVALLVGRALILWHDLHSERGLDEG
jgi:HTH-type transcriptional regulator / antitoxin HigA